MVRGRNAYSDLVDWLSHHDTVKEALPADHLTPPIVGSVGHSTWVLIVWVSPILAFLFLILHPYIGLLPIRKMVK